MATALAACSRQDPSAAIDSAAAAGERDQFPLDSAERIVAMPIGVEPASSAPLATPRIDTGVVARVKSSAAPEANPAVRSSDVGELRSHGLLIPVAGVKYRDLRDTFTEMRGSRVHNAIDIMAPRGTPVLSVDAGTLLKLHTSRAGGLTAYASDQGGRYVYLYAHLDSYYPGLREGAPLSRGDTIGLVGSTGNASLNAPHLHFGITRNDDMSKWWRGTPINPYPLLR